MRCTSVSFGLLAILLAASLCQASFAAKNLRADDQYINFLGRSDLKNGVRRFDWSGSRIRLNVTGTEFVDMNIDSLSGFEIIINGKVVAGPMYFNQNGYTRIPYKFNATVYSEVVVYKRTEPELPSLQASSFAGISISVDGRLASYEPSPKRVEFIGDSITCGYGLVGPKGCSGNGPQGSWESAYDNYVGIISRKLSLDDLRVAWSGRGMVSNCCGQNNLPVMPTLYKQTLGSDTTVMWDFQSWVPQLVVINLGTNDHNASPVPSLGQFTAGYVDFVKKLYGLYGTKLKIITVCGGMIEGSFCDATAALSAKVNAVYVNIPALTDDERGCDGHPNVKGGQKMADIIAPAISKLMGW